jgi:hypothetical protein
VLKRILVYIRAPLLVERFSLKESLLIWFKSSPLAYRSISKLIVDQQWPVTSIGRRNIRSTYRGAAAAIASRLLCWLEELLRVSFHILVFSFQQPFLLKSCLAGVLHGRPGSLTTNGSSRIILNKRHRGNQRPRPGRPPPPRSRR